MLAGVRQIGEEGALVRSAVDTRCNLHFGVLESSDLEGISSEVSNCKIKHLIRFDKQ